MGNPLFTPEELEEMRRADEEIEADFRETQEEYSAARRRDAEHRKRHLSGIAAKKAEYYERNREAIAAKQAEYRERRRAERIS